MSSKKTVIYSFVGKLFIGKQFRGDVRLHVDKVQLLFRYDNANATSVITLSLDIVDTVKISMSRCSFTNILNTI